MERLDYAVVIQPLPAEEGGGFVAIVPDLPGCLSDGESREEAARNATDAIAAWLEEAAALGRPYPGTFAARGHRLSRCHHRRVSCLDWRGRRGSWGALSPACCEDFHREAVWLAVAGAWCTFLAPLGSMKKYSAVRKWSLPQGFGCRFVSKMFVLRQGDRYPLF